MTNKFQIVVILKDSTRFTSDKTISVPQGLWEPGRKTKNPLDHGVSCGMKKEAFTALA
jgi:hypothetical protein